VQFSILNIHAPTEDTDEAEGSFYEKLEYIVT
jgi:hypothetical protein